MPLITQIEHELPLIAELPREWQMEIALVLSKFIIAYDNMLIKTPEEQRAERDREIASFKERYQSWEPRRERAPAIKVERRQR
jgi:hypothetical protein